MPTRVTPYLGGTGKNNTSRINVHPTLNRITVGSDINANANLHVVGNTYNQAGNVEFGTTGTGIKFADGVLQKAASTWQYKTSAYTANVYDQIVADTRTTGWTLTLPANSSCSAGDFVYLTCPNNSWATKNLVINPNGATIQGYSTMNVDVGPSIALMYFTNNWNVQ